MKESLEVENIIKAHYFFVGKNYRKVIKKLNERMAFYRISYDKKFTGKEIIFDVQSDMLSKAGLVLSKQYEDNQAQFKVRKISALAGGFKRPSKKFKLGQADDSEQPRDYALQIANAISNSFSTAFTVDLVSIVKQTIPKIEIVVKGRLYKIYGGTGYDAELSYEKATYKDVITKKKVSRVGFTLRLPKDEHYEQENNEILEIIDKYCKELVPYSEGRFEIAKRLLAPLNNTAEPEEQKQ